MVDVCFSIAPRTALGRQDPVAAGGLPASEFRRQLAAGEIVEPFGPGRPTTVNGDRPRYRTLEVDSNVRAAP